MKRPITGFALDDEGHWTALLDCGHRQHVRHQPPFINRPWVVTPQGRAGKLGEVLNCVRCDARELPDHFVARGNRSLAGPALIATAAGEWVRIDVTQGALHVRAAELAVDELLVPGEACVVVPGLAHALAPRGDLVASLTYFRAPDAA